VQFTYNLSAQSYLELLDCQGYNCTGEIHFVQWITWFVISIGRGIRPL